MLLQMALLHSFLWLSNMPPLVIQWKHHLPIKTLRQYMKYIWGLLKFNTNIAPNDWCYGKEVRLNLADTFPSESL